LRAIRRDPSWIRRHETASPSVIQNIIHSDEVRPLAAPLCGPSHGDGRDTGHSSSASLVFLLDQQSRLTLLTAPLVVLCVASAPSDEFVGRTRALY